MALIDISPRIAYTLAVWPGDVPFRREVALDMQTGANLTLSAIHTTLHLGAHADAPCHYQKGGVGIAERSLDFYYGPCQVIDVPAQRGARILPQHLRDDVTAPRVLLRTNTFPEPETFNDDFASLSPELVDGLHERGVILVGIDTPSIDPFADKVLTAHQAVARADMAILEGLTLQGVAPGLYTLIALPLKIAGADASPVRAALHVI